ncbi:HxlR family transcriptional regulator [Campylobacter jejuni subsp. jejuni]|nr:HxlR family transcriptional regulator [Campylobacter jejuni subsp. jejuni]
MTKENSPCNFEECGFNYTLALINGKYKMSILYCLFRYEIVRYNELKRFLSSISFKTLTNTLRELENDGLIIKKNTLKFHPR